MHRIILYIAVAVFVASIAACGGSSSSPAPTNAIDVNTLDGKTNITTDSTFRYTFSGNVDTQTVTTSSYFMVPKPASLTTGKAPFDPTLCVVDNAIDSASTPGTTTADLVPTHPLSGGMDYTVCLTDDITIGGTPITAFMASFTTEGGTTPQTERLRITNDCAYTIWIQQDKMPSATPQVVQLSPGAHQDYAIPAEGIASTRFWPKTGCDATGQNCTRGQSSPPCPAAGCAPPTDSLFEATWGCILSDQTQCAVNPSDPSKLLPDDTSWDTSAVDGFSLPYKVTIVSGSGDATCVDVDCSALSLDDCPTAEDLSTNGTYPAYTSEDLRVLNDAQPGETLGCYSACKKLNWPNNTGYNGEGLADTDPAAVMYCCPTPPISPETCRAGPAASTSYLDLIHTACTGGVYAYAYDDVAGLHNCTGETKFEVTFGPQCP